MYSLSNFPIYHVEVLTTVIMLYITSLVFIYLITRSLYLLITFLQFPLPQPLPLVTTNLINFSINLLGGVGVFCFGVFYIPHISELIQYLSFSVWLISLSTVPSRSTHVVENGRICSFFFCLNVIPLYIHTTLLYPFIR